mgnify:CR=1 FL=1
MENDIEAKIDVTPNPRILQMLGEIAFEPWQCIAELVDNSLDAYISATEANKNWLSDMGMENYSIDITLPTQHEYEAGLAILSVQDSGPGLTLEELKNAVTAGFSGNDPLGKLGLFGMGFNIATARLGRKTRIRTTRVDDTSWLVMELDLDEMQNTGKFHAQLAREPKEDDGYHGTIVEILRLKHEFKGNLTAGAGIGGIKKQLSRIYSAILNEQLVTMRLSENDIIPWSHCIWNINREAILGSGTSVPAYLQIDYLLPDYYFCKVCWHWSSSESVKENTCPACGEKNNIELKNRRIHGWLGIQRYFDQSHYGIDFIRNGRIIEPLSKECFYWNEDGEIELEYPIDTTHWGGRIVGQINIDFAQVDYQKTSFAKNKREWSEVVDYLRGTSPFRPRIAEERGYAENVSPLAKLFNTFRSGNRSGLRMLVPGGSDNPLKGDNADALAWAERYYSGDPDFQTDEKWWERVMRAERTRRGEEIDDSDDDDEEIDIDDPFGEGDQDDGEDAENDGEEDTTEYLILDKELSQRYDFPAPHSTVSPIEITVFRDSRPLRIRDLRNTPPLAIDTRQAPSRYSISYHPHHPAFLEFAETPFDYLLIELATWFSVRLGGGDWNAGRVYQNLKEEYQKSKKLDVQSLGQTATQILEEMKEHLSECKVTVPEKEVTEDLRRELTRDVMSTSGNADEVDTLLESGQWIERVSDEYMIPIIMGDPGLIMDGKFFSTSYEKITMDDIKQETVDRIISCLKDAIMIKKTASRSTYPDKSLLLRADAALNYLITQRV